MTDLAPFTSIVRLLFESGPTAIVGVVALLVVYPVNAAAFGSFAHVGEEVLELQPPITNFYSAPSVVREGFYSRVSASLQDSLPDTVRRTEAGAVLGMSVSDRAELLSFTQRAPARNAQSLRQMSRPRVRLVSTVALAQPDSQAFRRSLSAPSERDETTESLPGEIGVFTTAARDRISVAHRASGDQLLVAAVATDLPLHVSAYVPLSRFANDGQQAESVPDEIKWSAHA